MADYYAAHLGLIRQREKALLERHEIDVETWVAIDGQIMECYEEDKLSTGQYMQLHSLIERNLRLAMLSPRFPWGMVD